MGVVWLFPQTPSFLPFLVWCVGLLHTLLLALTCAFPSTFLPTLPAMYIYIYHVPCTFILNPYLPSHEREKEEEKEEDGEEIEPSCELPFTIPQTFAQFPSQTPSMPLPF